MTGRTPGTESFRQCASVPSPSEETRPMLVMTTSRALISDRSSPKEIPGSHCVLRGHQGVDLGAKVLHDEILFRRDRAVIDFLRPLLKRNLNAEFLVYRKDDVEKIKAVNPKMVNRVAFGRNRINVDFAGVGDDFRNFFKCCGHGQFPRSGSKG